MIKQRKIKVYLKEIIFFLLLFLISLFVTFQIHKDKGYFNWKSELWADKAGYYIYLPSFFYYHFDVSRCPEKIDERTGYGFNLDRTNNKINTKYTCGSAILLSPFFVATHYLSKILHIPNEQGFSPLFHKMINIAALVYLILGLWLMKRFLGFYFDSKIIWLVIFFTYAGTNLLYYALDDTMMSHVYSFFLFGLFLCCLKKFLDNTSRYGHFLVMCFAIAMIILMRPSNVILMGVFFFWDIRSWHEFKKRVRLFLEPMHIISFLIIVFLVMLPQMLYWKYLHGTFLFYSYQNEGFTNWNHPRIPEVLFSTLNGLFLYSPLVLLFIAGMVIMLVKKYPNGLLYAVFFLLLTYIVASWYNWYYGCSFGQRSYVEYYALFCVPFGFFLHTAWKLKNLFLKSILFILVLVFSYYNVRLVLSHEKCFFGSTWDWHRFGLQLENAGLCFGHQKMTAFKNDFENNALSYDENLSDSIFHSGQYSARVNPDKEFCCKYQVLLNEIGETFPGNVKIGVFVYKPEYGPLEALLVCSIEKNDSVLLWRSEALDKFIEMPGQWTKADITFPLPDWIDRGAILKIYIWNQKRRNFYADDLEITFE